MKSAASGTNFPSPSQPNLKVRGFAYAQVSLLGHALPTACSAYPSVSPHRSNDFRWYRNLNLLSIAYDFRPRLRSRLTPIRLTLTEKPWSFGEEVSHLLYRYLCLHLLFHTLHHSSPSGFDAYGMLPYHSNESLISVIHLMPVYYPRTTARLVSCYALFK